MATNKAQHTTIDAIAQAQALLSSVQYVAELFEISQGKSLEKREAGAMVGNIRDLVSLAQEHLSTAFSEVHDFAPAAFERRAAA